MTPDAAPTGTCAAAAAGPPPPFVPRQVIVFSGHMMDAPGRKPPRFPPAKEAAVAARIVQALDALGAGPADVALSQAAAGGDLLFVEAALQRGVAVQVLLPFAEAEFIERSVRPSQHGEGWVARYHAVRDALPQPPRVMSVELGPTPAGDDDFERANRWLLDTALACSAERVRFVCLWDGGGGDGPGGTRHMVDEVKRRAGRVTWIDIRDL